MEFGPTYACYWGPGDWRFEGLMLFVCLLFALVSLVQLALTHLVVAGGSKISISAPPRISLWAAALAVGVIGQRLLGDLWDLSNRVQYAQPFQSSAWTAALVVCALAIGACEAWRRSWPALAHAAAEPEDPRPLRLSL